MLIFAIREDNTEYVELLKRVCSETQFIEGWLTHYERFSDSPVLTSLERVAVFLQRVFCAWVLSDLHQLLERHMRLAAESIVRLVPNS